MGAKFMVILRGLCILKKGKIMDLLTFKLPSDAEKVILEFYSNGFNSHQLLFCKISEQIYIKD
jgi:hypothetical protein